jgi:hypothetical protein
MPEDDAERRLQALEAHAATDWLDRQDRDILAAGL